MAHKIILYGFFLALLYTQIEKGVAQDDSLLFSPVTLLLCGDVMLGRGIDQALPYPSDPVIYERYMRSALGYLNLAQRVSGIIHCPVDFSYVWGDALKEMERVTPDLWIINLETSITQSSDYMKNKGIHYRMSPRNAECLKAAGIDYCSLANNHIMDWGDSGLLETIKTLDMLNVESSGAGLNIGEASSPAILEVYGKGRVVIFSFGTKSSGIPLDWEATVAKPGVNLLKNLSVSNVHRIRDNVKAVKRKGDIVIISIHWGGNWGYSIPPEHIRFAHMLIDDAEVDVVYGHSSHHVIGIEVYKNKPVLYGCGDFLTDYEGISGYELFRDDLGLMYFLTIEPLSGKLIGMHMTPTRIKRFKVNRASRVDALWLRDVLNREGKRFGTRFSLSQTNELSLDY